MSDFERDVIILNACEELCKFRDYLDIKKIDVFTKIIQESPTDIIYPEIRWDSNFVEKSIMHIKHKIITAITSDVLKNVQRRTLNDPLFFGGSYSIALRLCLYYFYRNEKIDDINNLPVWFLSDCKYFNIDFFSFVQAVEKEYEIKYMRYRLWDDNSIKAFENYIFLSYKDYDEFDSPAILEYIDPSDALLTEKEFIEVLADILLDYPLHNFCEIRFPPYSEDGYIFAEFVPVKDMSIRYIEVLYNAYLQKFK